MSNVVHIRALESPYRGYNFRSRTEARWAVFFDVLGVEFEYEKEGFELPSGYYLPDFWLPNGDGGMWFEVKGQPPLPREVSLARELAVGTRSCVIIAVGTPEYGKEQLSFFNAFPEEENDGEGCSIVDERNGKPEAHLIVPEIGGWMWRRCKSGAVADACAKAKSARFERQKVPLDFRSLSASLAAAAPPPIDAKLKTHIAATVMAARIIRGEPAGEYFDIEDAIAAAVRE